MKNYEILEHKADLKIRAFGKTKEELFLNALLGMESGLRSELKAKSDPDAQRGRGSDRERRRIRKIKIKSLDINSLLVDFLSEVLYLIQTDREIYEKVKFTKFSDTEIGAELSGEIVERFGQDIKAVTYHDLDIKQKDGAWETVILFDI